MAEKELLGLVFAITKFRVYVEGSKFDVMTDSSALTWLFRVKQPSTRLVRWCLLLNNYAMKIIYIPGEKNKMADMLTRAPLADKPS